MRLMTVVTFLAVALATSLYAQDTDAKQTDVEETEEMTVFHDKGYLLAQSKDGLTKYWIDGRIMIDWGDISSDSNLASGTETRRTRLGVKTIFDGTWAGEFDIDFADSEIEIKDFWIGYVGLDNTIIKVGNHKPPGSMEEVTTSRWITFMERSLANAFAPSRRIGISYSRWGEKYFVMGGFYGEEPGKGEDTGEDEQSGFALRAAYTPIRTDDTVLHLGASYNSFQPDAGEDNEVRFRGRELHLMDRLLNTGKVDNVDDYDLWGFELAAKKGPWSFQSEYLGADLNRMTGEPDGSFDGFYAYVSWFAFGGERIYLMDAAEFGAVSPKTKKGALELALRFSNLNLNDFDAGIEGGEADNITFGINYYANEHVRIMLNYIRQDNDQFADGDGDFLGNDDLDIIATRFQLLF